MAHVCSTLCEREWRDESEDTRVKCGEFICNDGEICNESQECVEDVKCEGENCENPGHEPEVPGVDPSEPEKCGNVVCAEGEDCIDDECTAGYKPITCGSVVCTGDMICDEQTKTCVEEYEEPDPGDPIVPVVVEGAFVVSPTTGITTRRSG